MWRVLGLVGAAMTARFTLYIAGLQMWATCRRPDGTTAPDDVLHCPKKFSGRRLLIKPRRPDGSRS